MDVCKDICACVLIDVCTYGCVHICAYGIYLDLHRCMHVPTCMDVDTCMGMCLFGYAYVWTCVCRRMLCMDVCAKMDCVGVRMRADVCICIYGCVCMCECVHIDDCVHVHGCVHRHECVHVRVCILCRHMFGCVCTRALSWGGGGLFHPRTRFSTFRPNGSKWMSVHHGM